MDDMDDIDDDMNDENGGNDGNEEVNKFKDELNRIANDAFSRVTEKAVAIENLISLWGDENVRSQLLDETHNRKDLIEKLGYCVRMECHDNAKKISARSKVFKKAMFKIWKDVVNKELEDKHPTIKIDSHYETLQYLMRHNFDIWAKHEKAVWWETLDLTSKIIDHYSLAEVPFLKSQEFLPFCIEHFEKAVKSNERKDQAKIAKLLYILVKDVRLLQFSMDVPAMIGSFEFLFVENFKWESMNPARTIVLDIVYMLFVEFSHNCRTQLLQVFAPLARQLFPIVSINEKNVGNTSEQKNDSPCFNESLIRFLEIFIACAFPKCCTDVLDVNEDVNSLIDYCAKHIKVIVDKQYSKNITFYNKSPESVIPKQRLRFVARLLVVQHNLVVKSRSQANSPSHNSKRIRLETCLEEMISCMQPHYLVIFEEIFDKFESLLFSEILTNIVQTVFKMDVMAIRRGGSMNTYVKSLAMLLKFDRSFLLDEELNILFNKALNWLHIPSISDPTSILLQNLLNWLPARLTTQTTLLFDSVLKNVCRLSRLTTGAVNLLLFVIRSHDFNECFTFRYDTNIGEISTNAWKFRRELIMLILKDTEIDVDFSDLLLSLLFIYPNSVKLEQLISFSEDEITIVEENLSWVTKCSTNDDILEERATNIVSSASIPELVTYFTRTFEDLFFSDTLEQVKCPQFWRIFTIFRIKSERLNEKSKMFPMEEILQLQEKIDDALSDVAEESDAQDMLSLDLGCYWSFSSINAREAIKIALPNIPALNKFVAYWDTNCVPESFLENCIKSSRLHDSKFVSTNLQKLGAGRSFTEKTRLLRRYGKYLNQSEYSSLISYIRNDFDNEIARAADDNERVEFLMKMFSREIILSANRKTANFTNHLEFLLKNASTELILTFLRMESESSELLLRWFNLSANLIIQFPSQTAFFIKCLFKEIPASKILSLLLTLVESVDEHVFQFYIPNYNEIKKFALFLTEFQSGRFVELKTQNWNEIVDKKVFPMVLFNLRQRLKRIFDTASASCFLHLASALSTLSTIIRELKLQGKQLSELLMMDLIAVGKCVCVKLLEFKPRDDSGLSDLIDEWLNAVNCAVKLQADWIGFVALDLLREYCDQFPKLWENIMRNRLPFVMKYGMILLNPTAEECSISFENAYSAFKTGSLDCTSHPVIKSRIFWHWLIVKLNNIEVKRKSIAQLKRLWIICPWLRSELAQILCLFSEQSLRDKQCKVLSEFLEADDVCNIKLMASLILYDYVELGSDDLTRGLYNSIYQFESGVIFPKLDDFDLSYFPTDDNLLYFLIECLTQNSLCFKELQPFVVVGLNKTIFGILALTIMWRRLEENNEDTSFIFEKLNPLIKSLDAADCLHDFEILFLCSISEILTYKSIIKLDLPLIRCFLKAGLIEEAYYYFKYYIDFTEVPQRKLFHVRSSERSSLIRCLSKDEILPVADLFTKIVVSAEDDILAAALPLGNQYDEVVRSFVAKLRCDWGIAASLYEQLNNPLEASNALYHLGHKTFDLTIKDNYRRVIELSQWPTVESSTLSHPKCMDEHNATLYSLFNLTCRKQNYNLRTIWKDRLKEIEKIDIVYSGLLDECRDLKLLESLNLMKRSPETTKMPEDADLGLASAFLLAGWKKPETETMEDAFDSFFERMQKITLERVRDLRQKKSFQRAQSLLKVLEDVAIQYDEYRGSSAWLESAKLHLETRESNAAKFLLQKLINDRGDPDITNQQEIFERSASQAKALIMAAEMSDQPQKSDKHFIQALEVANNIEQADSNYVYECALKYANFAFKRYKELDDHTKSQHFLLQVEATQQLSKEIRKVSTQDDRNRRQKELDVEREDVKQIRAERNKFLIVSAKNFMRALSLKTENELIVPYLTSMIIQNVDNGELMTMIKEQLKKVPARVWIPVQDVLTSYLSSDKPISPLVNAIICQLITSHPFHSIYPMLFQLSSVKVPDLTLHNKRKVIVNEILSSCKKENPKLNEVFKLTKATYDILKDFGDAMIEDTSKFEHIESSRYLIRKNAFKLQKELKTLKLTPILTCNQPLNEPNDYSTANMIKFDDVIQEVIKAGGLSAPKIMEVRASNGNIYKLIFKPEDLRSDGLVQLLFQLSNIIFKGAAFRSKFLRPLQTYNVVPIDRSLGIIECCMRTISLNDYLVGPGRSGGAHQTLRPQDLHVREAHKRFGHRGDGKSLFESFMTCCNEISPVFRYFFYENFVQPHRFNKHIRLYTDSLALWSITCYIIGLGDRHLNNILIDKETGELIHIDLGMIFDYTKRVLPIPEKVPFRLTRDLVDPILVEGVNSRFKHVAVHALEQLRQNDQVIIGIASLLLHDPISAFGGEIKIEGVEKNMIAATSISRLRSKLEGRDLSIVSQDVEQQVTQLINDARNAKNLCLMFAGWMPFI